MYAISALTHYRTADGWQGTRELPTFYLDENVQGITSPAHAERVARKVLDPFGIYGNDLRIFALRVD